MYLKNYCGCVYWQTIFNLFSPGAGRLKSVVVCGLRVGGGGGGSGMLGRNGWLKQKQGVGGEWGGGGGGGSGMLGRSERVKPFQNAQSCG